MLKKSYKALLENPIILWVIIPFLCLLFWIFASIIYVSFEENQSFFVISIPQATKELTFSEQNLLKDTKVKGRFIAKENNLGIVSIKVHLPLGIFQFPEDTITFRIREVGSKEWLQTNTYTMKMLLGYDYFPFGFSTIKNSKGKEYEFEVTSLYGDRQNSLLLKSYPMPFYTKYLITKQSLLSFDFFHFLLIKITYFFQSIYNISLSLIFLTPFILYVFLIIIVNFPIRDRRLLVFLLVYLIVFDIFFIKTEYYAISILILGLWVIISIYNQLSYRATLLLACLMLIFCVGISMTYPSNLSIDKASFWLYIFILYSFLQNFYQEKILRKYSKYFTNLLKTKKHL